MPYGLPFYLTFTPVKLLFFIFASYLLVLSIVPCGDKDECREVTESIAAKHADTDKHNDDTENCSPFCSCSCCAASIVYNTVIVYKMAKKVFPPIYFAAPETHYTSGVSFSIWQPPKFSI